MWSYLTLCGVDARAVVAAEGVKVSWCQCEWWRVNRLHSDAATAAAAAPPPRTFRGFSAQRLQPQLMSNIFTGFKIFLRCQYLALQCRQRCCLLTGVLEAGDGRGQGGGWWWRGGAAARPRGGGSNVSRFHRSHSEHSTSLTLHHHHPQQRISEIIREHSAIMSKPSEH